MSLDDEGDEAWDGSDETDMNQTMLPIVLVVAFRIEFQSLMLPNVL